ncbi:MAG: hypothetical protein WCW68_01505 [Methanothrix sp.]|jgi:hypothetical protein
MEDRSNIRQEWYAIGTVRRGNMLDLLVRWNERQETREGENGPEIEYVYDATRIDVPLPNDIEDVGAYLESIKDELFQNF